MRACAGLLLMMAMSVTASGDAPRIEGSISVNGETGKATHVSALEIDSDTEPGYMDVLVVLADRPLDARQMRDVDELERLTRDAGLIALRVLLDPDCEVKSVSYYHPAFAHFLVNAGENVWQPSVFDDRVGGRIHSNGEQTAFGQRWRYDFTFSAPIVLDPEAKTIARSS